MVMVGLMLSLLIRQIQITNIKPGHKAIITTTTTTESPLNAVDSKFTYIYKLLYFCYEFGQNDSQASGKPLNPSFVEGKWCPRFFDGFTCWDESPPNTTLEVSCPSFVDGFDSRLSVRKTCSKRGVWLSDDPTSSRSWTNYTSCVDLDDLHFRTEVNNMYVIGYSVSVAALLLALLIFYLLRSIYCTRIRIHVHLFTSMALNNILWILWYKLVVSDVEVVKNNKEWCQLLHVFVNYFMVTSYFWTFCEGLHLHIALVVVFVKDEVAMPWFLGIGWCLSFVVVGIYAIARFFYGNIERCWMDMSDTLWIITVPVVISILISLAFLINVVRVLMTKLPGQARNQNALVAKKAIRAAFILIPLFGLHFLLIPLRPETGSSFEKVYQVVSALITSLQGLVLAILFCFTNHDVTTAAKLRWSRFRNSNEGIPMIGITIGDTTNTRDNGY